MGQLGTDPLPPLLRPVPFPHIEQPRADLPARPAGAYNASGLYLNTFTDDFTESYIRHGDAKPLIDPYAEQWENDFGAEGLFQDLYSGRSTDTGIPSTTPGSRINPAVLERSDTAEGDNMELAHRALPMDELHVETPARRLPPTHPFESDGLFHSIVLDSAGKITQWKIHNKRSLFPTVLASRLTKGPSVFKCPLPGCKVFTVGIDIGTVYKHLDDDKHGIAFGKQNNMVLCPTNCGYDAISDHHLTMYHMPKCPSIKAAELQPDHRFKCSHCDAVDMLLLDFATHWDFPTQRRLGIV
ncbi:hypothetical protein KCU78_g7922, partial [Aureobasidium melanogenum]